jgi:hypothetical protein
MGPVHASMLERRGPPASACMVQGRFANKKWAALHEEVAAKPGTAGRSDGHDVFLRAKRRRKDFAVPHRQDGICSASSPWSKEFRSTPPLP